MTYSELAAMARQAREAAYCPYSRFSVGAALLCDDGTVYTGCNVENASFGAGTCAERNALYKAVSDGKHRFTAIAVAGGTQGQPVSQLVSPCGICRQALAEFCGPQTMIVLCLPGNEIQTMTFGSLLPLAFGAASMGQT